MKKLIFIGLLSSSVLLDNGANAQALKQGNVIVDAYYGFPNLYTSVLRAAYNNSSASGVTIKGMGPLGIRGEYMFAEKLGIGLDIGFNSTSISYDYDHTENYVDVNGNYVINRYTDKISTKKIGVMPTFNLHFLKNDKVDAYAVFGVGYGNRSFKYESTNPSFVEAKVSGLIPVASRIGVGMRYFFTENIGANLALGFGQGGLFNVGLSAKF